MKLAMILGKKQGDAIKPRLQNIKDNLDIDVFDDIPEFVYNVSKRNTIYDRILVLSTKVTSNSLRELHTCWGMVSKETNVIMLSRKDADEDKAQTFLNTFKTPVACAMLVSSTTVQIIAESVLRPTAELNKDYGIKDFLSVEVEDDEYVAPEPPKPVQKPAQTQQQSQQPASKKPQKKKRGGLLSGIFGSRGDLDDEPEQAPQQEQESGQESVQQPVAEPTQVPEPAPQSDAQDDDFGDDFGSSPVSDEDFGSDDFSPQEEELPPVRPQAPVEPQRPAQQTTQSQQQRRVQQQRPQQNRQVVSRQASPEVDVTFEDTFDDDSSQVDDFAPEVGTTDVNFGDEGLVVEPEAPRRPTRRPSGVEQSDEDFGEVNIATAEAQYRKQKEAPKIITRTVRESSGGGSALKGVYSGRLKKIIVVTGDRGTGVTSTALNLAQTLAKHIQVLYFDCDVDNHGLLNYIDYSEFKNYENTHMNGVKVCKSSQVFDRCVISWDNNLSFLTTDYSCDCTNEELEEAGQIVAERSMDFGVVIVDCPVDKLPFITDLLLTGQAVICVEGSKRGFMNMLCRLESSKLPVRYKRNLIARGTMFVTKYNPKIDMKRLLAYIKAIYQPSDVDWLSVKPVPFNGRLSDALLNTVMEG